MKDAIKLVNKELLTASRELFPKLKAESDALKAAVDKLNGGTGALMRSYFTLGEQLRRLALEQGGYVSKLQAEQVAQKIASEGSIELSQAMAIVAQQARSSGFNIQGLETEVRSLGQITRESRQEARLFRFAIMESMHAFDGLATSVGALTGATEAGRKQFKSFTDAAQEGANTGLGLAFAMKAIGEGAEKFALPVSTVVGGVTVLGSAVVKLNEAMKEQEEQFKKNELEIVSLKDKYEELLHELHIINDTQVIDDMGDSIDRLTKRAKELNNIVPSIDIFKTLLSGAPQFKFEAVPKNEKERLEDAIRVNEAIKKLGEQRLKDSKDNAEQASHFLEEVDRQNSEEDKAREKARKEQEKEAKDHDKEVAESVKFMYDLESMFTKDGMQKLLRDENKSYKERAEQLRAFMRDIPEQWKTFYDELQKLDKDHVEKRNEILYGVKGVKAPPEIKPLKDMFDQSKMLQQVLKENAVLIEPLAGAFQNLGNAVERDWIDRIVGSTSVFQRFVGDVLDGLQRIIAKLVAMQIFKGILSFIPGLGAIAGALSANFFASGGIINEPVVGMGMKTGGAYVLGESGAERVSPLTSFGGNSETTHRIVGVSRISGRDILTS